MRIGVVKESGPGERRVAAVPAVVARRRELGADVPVEHDVGVEAAHILTNPAARRPGNPVSGVPILDVDHARSVIVIKRSMVG